MMTPGSLGQSWLTKAVTKPVEMARTGVTAIGTGIKKRFRDGIEAGRGYYAREMKRTELEENHSLAIAVAAEGALCGFLVSSVAGEALALFEGGNRIKVDESGRVRRFDGKSDDGWFIRVIEDRAEVEDVALRDGRQSLETNETLSLGGESFTLKLIPESSRPRAKRGGRS